MKHINFRYQNPTLFWVIKVMIVLFFGLSFIGAADTLAQENDSGFSVIADVNLVNQGIVKQEGRNFTLGVNMQNKIGTQSGVLYGVQVYQMTEGEKRLVDEFAAAEALTIKQDQYAYREFDYQLPLTVSGKVELVAFLKTDKGILLSAASIQEMEIEPAVVLVDIKDCVLDEAEKKLKCTFTNNTDDNQIIVFSTQVKQGNSTFAPVVQVLVPQEIVLQAGETKEITQNIDDQVFSKDAFFETTVTDQNRTFLIERTGVLYKSPQKTRLVNNVLINQTSARNYDIKIVSLSSGVPTQAKINIFDERGICATKDVTIEQTVTSVDFVLEKACDAILVSASMVGENGVETDRFETKHQTLFPEPTMNYLDQSRVILITIVASSLLALFFLYFIIRNRQKKLHIKA